MHNMRTFILLCGLLWNWAVVYAEIEVRSARLTVADGLANNSVRCICQDDKGFIWLGTLDGLNRYDGSSFLTFQLERKGGVSLADHRVRSLSEDKNGYLWIRYMTSLYSCYDLRKGSFVDFTGCGEHLSRYHSIYIPDKADEDVWLWGSEDGCRRVACRNGILYSEAFRKGNGMESDQVNDLKPDGKGGVWIATSDGFYHWDGQQLEVVLKGKDIRYVQERGDKAYFLSADGIMYVSSDGNAEEVCRKPVKSQVKFYGDIHYADKWMVFTSGGNLCFDFATETFVRPDERLDVQRVQIIEDNRQDYWIYNGTGKLRYVQVETGQIRIFEVMSEVVLDYIDEERYSIVHDSRGLLWIATYGNGLFVYNLREGTMQHFTADGKEDVNRVICSDYLLCLMEDRLGNMWVSSEFAGIDKLTIINEGAFYVYPNGENQLNRSNAVRFIACVDGNNIYATTRMGDVVRYSSSTFMVSDKKKFNTNIYAIVEDTAGVKWYGTRGRGLLIGKKQYMNDPSDSLSLSSNQIYNIMRDNKGRMWIGTFGGGLNLAVRKNDGTYQFRRFFNTGGENARVRCLCEDRNGWIWMGTSRGIYVFRPNELIRDKNAYYTYDLEKGCLYSNEIRSLFSDSEGRMWIAETGSGFSYCMPGGDYAQLEFTHYGVADGLVNNMVQAFVEDSKGNMWISTEYGISCFDRGTCQFDNHFFSAHVLGNIYSENCGIRLPDGRLAFGTNYGFTVIDPQFVRPVNYDMQLIFTDLKLNGISESPGVENSPLRFSMPYLSELHLKHFQNSFSIDFSTMDYIHMGLQRFSVMLEGHDKSWSPPSSQNFVAYKNLQPGTYFLHVKAQNALDVWNTQDTVLKIVISPPFWRSGWAYVIYVLFTLGILGLGFHVFAKMDALRNRIKVDEQLTEYKLMFFTNISHEFRTPLTLIQNALEKIQFVEGIPKELEYPVKVMEKSVRRMLRLVNQLLEFRKMQNDKLALSLEKIDVIGFLKEIYWSFMEIAKSKDIVFSFVPSVENYEMYIDRDKVDKIIYNLLSNAFKYTPSKGKVELHVSVEEPARQLVICVADTGVGIPKDKRNELFTRFAKSRYSSRSVGIGLHLTHELVTVHKGTIVYRENPGGGSRFVVSLPADKSVYEEKDFLIQDNVLLQEEHSSEHVLPTAEDVTEDVQPVGMPSDRRKVLVVEDDHDIREYMRKELGEYFEIAVEADGQAGLERTKSDDFDLIVSDVMMPGLSGFELTKRLKSDFATSHIPVILLTALESDSSHVKGIDCGADAYITKPFSMRLLLTRILRLIEQRDKLREKFSNEPGVRHTVICTDTRDQRFADKLASLVEERISDAQFSVDDLLASFNMGRSVFYRKVKGVTGYSPAEYIRVLRMKKAAELLLQTDMNVGEISRKVGVNDPFYFSKCFKSQFGVSPSAYQKNGGQVPEGSGNMTK